MPARRCSRVRLWPVLCQTRLSMTMIEPAGASSATLSVAASSAAGLRFRRWLPGTMRVAPFSSVKSSTHHGDVHALRLGRPRLGHEDLVGVQDHLAAAGPGDVGRDVAQKRRPAERRLHQPERQRVLDQVGEDRIAAEEIPHPLIGLVMRIVEAELLLPAARPVLARRAIQRLAHASRRSAGRTSGMMQNPNASMSLPPARHPASLLSPDCEERA